jgi:hypothetical protein
MTTHYMKLKANLCLTKHHAMKTYCWAEAQLHALTSALDGGEWSASRCSRFIPVKIAPSTHWIGACVGRTADLDAVAKTKYSLPAVDGNLTPDVQLVA